MRILRVPSGARIWLKGDWIGRLGCAIGIPCTMWRTSTRCETGWAGSVAYLIFLGLKMIITNRHATNAFAAPSPGNAGIRTIFWQGELTNKQSPNHGPVAVAIQKGIMGSQSSYVRELERRRTRPLTGGAATTEFFNTPRLITAVARINPAFEPGILYPCPGIPFALDSTCAVRASYRCRCAALFHLTLVSGPLQQQ